MNEALQMADVLAQKLTPVVMVPRASKLAALERNGERYLAVADGLMIEVVRPYVRAVLRIAHSKVQMPFGSVEQSIELRCGPMPLALIDHFRGEACATSDREIAAWVTWNEATGAWNYLRPRVMEVSGAHVQIERPRLSAGEHLVLDLHSHARFPAGFSRTDNRDDAHEVKFAGVVGRCDQAQPEFALRLCAAGVYHRMATPYEQRAQTTDPNLDLVEWEFGQEGEASWNT